GLAEGRLTVAVAVAVAVTVAVAGALAITVAVTRGRIAAGLGLGVAIAIADLGAAEGYRSVARLVVGTRSEQRERSDEEGGGKQRGSRRPFSERHARARLRVRPRGDDADFASLRWLITTR